MENLNHGQSKFPSEESRIKTIKESRSLKYLLRQCLVTAGVSFSMMEMSLVIGFTAILLPQLRNDPKVDIDENTESWIASINGFSFIPGAFLGPYIINKYGRRKANLISAIIITIGWIFLILSSVNIPMILIARFLQGIALGLSCLSGCILIAEYTSPLYRGAFLTSMNLTISAGALLVHTIGSYVVWQKTAIFCLSVAILDSILVFISPESPVFLATHGKFDECKKVFQWLRDSIEDEELYAMIEVEKLRVRAKRSVHIPDKYGLTEKITIEIKLAISTIKKTEFYKPLILILHLDMVNIWSGCIMIDAYGFDILKRLIGNDVNIPILMMSINIFKLISVAIAMVIHTKFNRRSTLKIFTSLNILFYILTASYSYAKEKGLLSLDRLIIGAALIYAHVFTIVAGTVPLASIISGEIFPLQYKAVCTLIATIFTTGNLTIVLKTLPFLFSKLGLSGAYCIYGVVVLYSTIVSLSILPETKGKTLQHIEERYWKKLQPDSESTPTLRVGFRSSKDVDAQKELMEK